MKGKILTLIIGILIGAILATCGFIVYDNMNEKEEDSSNNNVTDINSNEQFEMRGGNGGQRPDNFSGDDENMPSFEDGEMPEPPDGDFEGEMPDGEPPAKPDGDNSLDGGMRQNGGRPGQNNSNNSTFENV